MTSIPFEWSSEAVEAVALVRLCGEMFGSHPDGGIRAGSQLWARASAESKERWLIEARLLLDVAAKAQPLAGPPCCPTCKGETVVNVSVGALVPECDPCPTCNGGSES